MNQVNEQLKKSCEAAIGAFRKLNNENYDELQSKLEWCIGSFAHDNNPSGLHEYGLKSLDALKKIKATEPRKVNKKVIDTLERAIAKYGAN